MDPIAAKLPRVVHGPKPTQDFTVISNSVLRDERLSYRARGVLLEILSHGPDWVVDSTEMSQRGAEGRDAIRTAFAELKAAGYLVHKRVQGDRGLWNTVTVVFANPQVVPETGNQASVFQASDNQAPVRPAAMDVSAGRTGDGYPGVGFPGFLRSTETKELPTTSSRRQPPAVTDRAAEPEGLPATISSGKIVEERKRPSRIPDDFQVTSEMVAWCRRNFPAIDGRNQTERFIAYWKATPGKKGEKVNWDQAWMRWIRKAAEINGARDARPGNAQKRSTTDERVQQGLDLVEYFEQLEAGDAAGSTRKGLGR